MRTRLSALLLLSAAVLLTITLSSYAVSQVSEIPFTGAEAGSVGLGT